MSALLGRSRLIAVIVALLALVGLLAQQTMPRQEDPSFAERFATLLVPFPGASPTDVERLVLDPVEDTLREVVEVRATARAGVAVFQLRLRDAVAPDATDAAWDDVRRAIDRARRDLPPEALPLPLDTQVGDPATAVYLVHGSDDALALRAGAKRLADRLERVPGVERAVLVGDPGRQAAISLQPERADRLGLTPAGLAERIRAANATVPGGSVTVDGRSVVIRHLGELRDVDAVRALPIRLPSGETLPLGSIADVDLRPAVPRTTRVLRSDGPAVGVSVVPVPAQDLVALGARLRAAVDEVALDPLAVEVFAFQPDEVEARLRELGGSLLLGVAIVAGVLMLAMGPRLGFVVASIVPLVALSAVGVYALGGGVLHQISVAALVLALGLLVDNAIVVAEAVQQHLDAGHPDPAGQAVRELAAPLGAATGTTVAAFVPMLLAEGGTADFTRAIPIVVIVTLVLSYGFAIAVTPLLAARLLRPGGSPGAGSSRLALAVGGLATRRPVAIVAVTGIAVFASALLATRVPSEFFPMSDRLVLMVSVALPEGTHALETEATVSGLLDALAADPEVERATAFVGGDLPRFYYNLNDAPGSPHHAEIALTARSAGALPGLIMRVEALGARWPEATLIARRLQQGPPVGAPVQIRLTGDDPNALRRATDRVVASLRETPGAREVRHDLGTGVPSLEVRADDAWLARRGLGRAALPLATLAQTHGLDAGRIRTGADPIAIVVGAPDAESTPTTRLGTLSVGGTDGLAPLAHLGALTPAWGPAAIHHRDGAREVTVSAELAAGATFGSVLSAWRSRAPELPDGVSVGFGGEAEGSEEANGAIVRALPIGLGLLVLFLLIEFDSFRRLGLVLVTVPLASVGVIPGLALTGQPFGFMSMLGVIALIGVVVNNAIVLLEVIEQRRADGVDVPDAVREAVRVRMRPILLTTATTVAGMIPLALSGSALWPPLASAMISGLLASTALTLLAVPALYMLLFGPRRRPRPWLLALLLPVAAPAAELDLQGVLDAAARAPESVAAAADARADRADATARWLDAMSPRLVAQAEQRRRDAEIALDTPIGAFVQQPKVVGTVGARVVQPLLDPSGWAAATAATHGARATQALADHTRATLARDAGAMFLDLVVAQARVDAADALAGALDEAARRANDLASEGLALESDALRAAVAASDARQAARAARTDVDLLGRAIAARLGLDEPVQAKSELGAPPTAPARSDRDALDAQSRALQAARAAHGSALLPRVELDLGWQATDNAALVKGQWADGAIVATWALGAGRIAAVDAGSSRLAAVRARADALERGIAFERESAAARLALARADRDARALALEQAESAARVLRARHAEQLAPLTDLLAAEAALAGQRVALRQADAEIARAGLDAAYNAP